MRAQYYQAKVLGTAGRLPDDQRVICAALGLAGEAGEVADAIKKVAFHGHELNREHLRDELGDVLWYVAYAADALGYTLDDVMRCNLQKLHRRYPAGFSSEASRNRRDSDHDD